MDEDGIFFRRVVVCEVIIENEIICNEVKGVVDLRKVVNELVVG